MPYIPKNDRWPFHGGSPPRNAGQLAYALSTAVDDYLDNQRQDWNRPPKYEDWATVVGVLETLKLELQRRFIGPYEEEKLKANGDVFTFQGPGS